MAEISRVDAAAMMFGVGSKQHKQAQKKFGPSGGPKVKFHAGSADGEKARLAVVAAREKSAAAEKKAKAPAAKKDAGFEAKHPRKQSNGRFKNK